MTKGVGLGSLLFEQIKSLKEFFETTVVDMLRSSGKDCLTFDTRLPEGLDVEEMGKYKSRMELI